MSEDTRTENTMSKRQRSKDKTNNSPHGRLKIEEHEPH